MPERAPAGGARQEAVARMVQRLRERSRVHASAEGVSGPAPGHDARVSTSGRSPAKKPWPGWSSGFVRDPEFTRLRKVWLRLVLIRRRGEGLPMPSSGLWERAQPGTDPPQADRSGEAKRTCREPRPGGPRRTSGERAWAAPSRLGESTLETHNACRSMATSAGATPSPRRRHSSCHRCCAGAAIPRARL
jgi:hypothetical protein